MSINGETLVYSAAAWWRECDPSMQAVTLTIEETRKQIFSLMREAAKSAWDSDMGDDPDASEEESEEDGIERKLDDIAWSGVHAFALQDLCTPRTLPEAIKALEDDGVFYPDCP